MSLIDIRKLNAEIDQMIANQKVEIDDMREKANTAKAVRYMQFVTTLEEMSYIVRDLGANIRVYLGSFNNGYGSRKTYWLQFNGNSCRRIHIQYSGNVNPAVTQATIHIDVAYPDLRDRITDQWNLIDQITEWWYAPENAASMRKQFEDACIKAIKEKAERANAEYIKAKEEYGAAVKAST